MASRNSFCTLFLIFNGFNLSRGMLFPQYSEARQIQELDGFWNFRADDSPDRQAGFEKEWYLRPLEETGPVILMPICSSFNDITTDKKLQRFVGWVWYERSFYVDPNWKNKRIVLRIESAHYNSVVWVNGRLSVTHSGGHLPFEAEVNQLLNSNKTNRVTVAINNTLTPNTLPTGYIEYPKDAESYPPGYFTQNLRFDFFNYAGLHRKVRLYTTPSGYVDDITVSTASFDASSAQVEYGIEVKHCSYCADNIKQSEIYMRQEGDVLVEVEDKSGRVVATDSALSGRLTINKPHLWWPYTMSTVDFGYLYTLKVSYGDDMYRQKFGIRKVGMNNRTLLINNKPFYCLGVAKHEDSDIRGKGLDLPLIARDFNMLKWLGVNCFRTSHYPYADEILDVADTEGVVVIDESTAVGLQTDGNFNDITLAHHLNVMRELIGRDKNHPAVIMWSIANEPKSGNHLADSYFKKVVELTRSLDPTRLVTMAISETLGKDLAAKYLDVLCINRYYAWYRDAGHLSTIRYKLLPELKAWHETYDKPVIITEYGADTVAGLHTAPSYVFTEEFQVEFLSEYHSIFDEIRSSFLTGEMVWNFADFMTDESVTRVVGNRKGLLTRQRQPKMSAHLIRKRYWSIANETSPHQ